MSDCSWSVIHPDFKLSNYQISTNGRIKNIRKGSYPSKNTPQFSRFNKISLRNDEQVQKVYRIDYLVARTFLNDDVINNDKFWYTLEHVNGDNRDDRLENLFWKPFPRTIKRAWIGNLKVDISDEEIHKEFKLNRILGSGVVRLRTKTPPSRWCVVAIDDETEYERILKLHESESKITEPHAGNLFVNPYKPKPDIFWSKAKQPDFILT